MFDNHVLYVLADDRGRIAFATTETDVGCMALALHHRLAKWAEENACPDFAEAYFANPLSLHLARLGGGRCVAPSIVEDGLGDFILAPKGEFIVKLGLDRAGLPKIYGSLPQGSSPIVRQELSMVGSTLAGVFDEMASALWASLVDIPAADQLGLMSDCYAGMVMRAGISEDEALDIDPSLTDDQAQALVPSMLMPDPRGPLMPPPTAPSPITSSLSH